MQFGQDTWIHQQLEPNDKPISLGLAAPKTNIVDHWNQWDLYRVEFITKYGQDKWDAMVKQDIEDEERRRAYYEDQDF
jgi:hypothetical protein